MAANNDHLAFTEDIPVSPNVLPGFLGKVKCSEIRPNPNYPGFVQLRHVGNMRYDWH